MAEGKKNFIIRTIDDMIHADRMGILRYLHKHAAKHLKPYAMGTAINLDLLDDSILDELYDMCRVKDDEMKLQLIS